MVPGFSTCYARGNRIEAWILQLIIYFCGTTMHSSRLPLFEIVQPQWRYVLYWVHSSYYNYKFFSKSIEIVRASLNIESQASHLMDCLTKDGCEGKDPCIAITRVLKCHAEVNYTLTRSLSTAEATSSLEPESLNIGTPGPIGTPDWNSRALTLLAWLRDRGQVCFPSNLQT